MTEAIFGSSLIIQVVKDLGENVTTGQIIKELERRGHSQAENVTRRGLNTARRNQSLMQVGRLWRIRRIEQEHSEPVNKAIMCSDCEVGGKPPNEFKKDEHCPCCVQHD